MAKKSFGVRNSLSVQPKPISPDEVEKAIKRIHQEPEPPEEVEAPEPKPSKAKTKSKPASRKKAAAKQAKVVQKKEKEQRKVRLSVDVTPQIHKRLKIRAIERDSDIMRYVAMLIEKDLAKK